MCAFPDRASFLDAVLRIGETEIGYNAMRTATAAYLDVMAPHLFTKLTNATTLQKVLGKTLEYVMLFVLAGDSEGEIAFQSAALKAIVADHGGLALDMGVQARS